MNKRARTRLIGVSAIILIAVAAIFLAGGKDNAAYYKTVDEVATDSALVGERVKVGGTVINGSWDKKQNPMTFTIRDEEDKQETGKTVRVVYNGPVPSTFGDGVVAIVTGDLAEDGTIAADDMITKCPSKYESAKGAMPVSTIKEGQALETVKITGFIKPGTIKPPGGAERFTAAGAKDGTGKSISVQWDGALPEGMTDGTEVVLTGELHGDGTFTATQVALPEK